jgi:hypothetical protein
MTCRSPAPTLSGAGPSALALTRHCFDPVVLLFGLGEQFRFCGFASFSQAAMLAYLQFSAPLADVLMQNGELPIVCDFCMLLFDDGEPIVPCAWAKETPATNAATAVKVVNVFIISLLGGGCAGARHSGTTGGKGWRSRNPVVFGKKVSIPAKSKRPGKVPGRRLKFIVFEIYASTIATISCVRGLMITI